MDTTVALAETPIAEPEPRPERGRRRLRDLSLDRLVYRIRSLGGKVSRGELSQWERGYLRLSPEKEAIFVQAYEELAPREPQENGQRPEAHAEAARG